MKNNTIYLLVLILFQFFFSCTSSKKTLEPVVVTHEEHVGVIDTVAETNNVIVAHPVAVTDTLAEVEEVVEMLEPKAPATFIDSITTLYDSLIGDSKQLLVVYNHKASSIVSEMRAYELGDDGWVAVDELAAPCNVGRKGFAAYGKKAEGDKKSPTGIFTITHYFSKYPKFNARLEKIKVTRKTVWVDDSTDPMYNRYCEQDDAHPKKGENLIRKDAQYDYVMVINYNTEECTPYKGSAIFFHVWSRPGGGTAGCVAVEKQHILKIFDWIDADKHPKIVMGSLENDGIFQIK